MKTLPILDKLTAKFKNKSSPTNTPSQPKSHCHKLADESQNSVFNYIGKIHPPIMMMISVISLTGLISYRFYNQPELAVGTISPTQIVAPADGSFVDEKTTEELRKKIRNTSLRVFREDLAISNYLKSKLDNQIQQIDSLRNFKNNLLPISSGILSTDVQNYLYTLSDAQWQKIVTQIDNSELRLPEPEEKIRQQLSNYQQNTNPLDFDSLLRRIEQNRDEYVTIQEKLRKMRIDNLNDSDKNLLLNLEQKEWGQAKKSFRKAHNLILTQGIATGLPNDMMQATVRSHLQDDVTSSLTKIGVKVIVPNLKPNLTIDTEKTSTRAEKEAQKVEPVVVSIKKNQLIVDAGEEISQTDFVLLDNFNLSRRGITWTGVAASGALSFGSIILFVTIAERMKKKLRRRDQILLLLFSLSIPTVNLFNVNYNPLPAVGFLTSTFYAPTLAVTQVTLMTGLTLFQTDTVNWQFLIPSFTSALLASLVANRLHSREELSILGGGIGLTQGTLYLIVSVLSRSSVTGTLAAIVPSAIGQATLGLGYSILALGISPYLERFFDLITPIRLAELSNPNRPLLKRLALEAPGTFQHTMFVASLAEAAARRLHCNVELVRAGTLYHDIGKMHDPLGFIENQMGGPNKHDEINDPWVSAQIIKKHVSEGIIMAKKCGLPQALCDFIPQHQGTLLISYFYFQAKNQAESNPDLDLNDEDFRYDGPIPQYRETGIVMLADGCEAALRSLKDATPDQAMAMVQKIFKARWRDHQLDDCGIKYEELPIIAEVFVTVWQQFNHQRISYPKGALEVKPSHRKPKAS